MTEETPNVQQALDDLKNGFSEFRDTVETNLGTRATMEQVDVLVKEKVDRIQDMFDKNTQVVERAGQDLQTANTRIDELETALSRTGTGETREEDLELRAAARELILSDAYDSGRQMEDLEPADIDELDLNATRLYNRHFKHYLRKGQGEFLRRMGSDLETRLLSVDRDPGGGYWVRPEVSSRITSIVFETSPIRQFAAIENISSDSIELIADENEAGFGWVGEQQTRPETTTPDIGKRVIHAHEQYAEPRATQKLLDDAGFDVEGWLAGKVADRFARSEATAFVTGDGVAQPRGFTTYPAGTAIGQIEQIASAGTDVIEPDDVYNMIYSIKSPYLSNARWMMARLTIRDFRLLRSDEPGTADQGMWLWEPNMQTGQPQMLGGYPLHQADDMAAVGSDTLPAAFGDFRAGYTIVDRMGIRTLRDPYTAKPNVKFYTTRRVGGDVVNYEAIKLLNTT